MSLSRTKHLYLYSFTNTTLLYYPLQLSIASVWKHYYLIDLLRLVVHL